MTREIRNLSFLDEGISIEFLDVAEDLKANGLLMNHAVLVPDNSDYHDEIEALRRLANEFLDSVLEDWSRVEPALSLIDDPAPDAPGPYDNPLERNLDGAT